MTTAEEANVLLAQQQSNINQARQSAIAARQQLSQFQIYEQPTVSQLLSRGQFGALQAKTLESPRAEYRLEQERNIRAYEKSISEAEQQLKANQEAVSNLESTEAEFERGRKLAFSSEPLRASALTTEASRLGYKYGLSQDRYARAKIQYQKDLLTAKAEQAIRDQYKIIYDSSGNITGVEDLKNKQSIPIEKMTDQQIKDAGLIVTKTVVYTDTGQQTQTVAQAETQKPKPVNIFGTAAYTLGTLFGGWLGKKAEEKGYGKPGITTAEGAEQYKGTILGTVYSAASSAGTEISKVLQTKIVAHPGKNETGVTVGKLIFGNLFSTETTPAEKFVESITPEQYSQVLLWTAFSPLMSTGAAKKGSKQATVQEEKKAPKITKKDIENAIMTSTKQETRDAMIKIIESGNKDAINIAKQSLENVLGKEAANNIFNDALQQAAVVPIISKAPSIAPVKKTAEKVAEVTAKEIAAAKIPLSAYFGMPEYSFAEIQTMTNKALGIMPANIKYAGIIGGIESAMGIKQNKAQKVQQQQPLAQQTILKVTQEQNQISLQKTAQASLSLQKSAQVSLSLQMPMLKLEEFQASKSVQAQRPRTAEELRSLPEEMPIWRLVSASTLKQKPKGLFEKKRKKAYQLFIKRHGKNILIGQPTTKGRALFAGENIARTTLARTFGVFPTKRTTEREDITYTPSQMFRGYSLRKGKRIPLIDTYIQKRKFSLSSMGERLEIKAARRSKAGSLKWF